MTIDLQFTSELTAIAIINKLIQAHELVLERAGKVATGRTLRSLRGEEKVVQNRITIQIFGGKQIEFIVLGKRANTKKPLRKVGDDFELYPEIQEWKKAVGFEGSDYQLADSIARNPRKGIPIVKEVIALTNNEIQQIIAQGWAQQVARDSTASIRAAFTGL